MPSFPSFGDFAQAEQDRLAHLAAKSVNAIVGNSHEPMGVDARSPHARFEAAIAILALRCKEEDAETLADLLHRTAENASFRSLLGPGGSEMLRQSARAFKEMEYAARDRASALGLISPETAAEYAVITQQQGRGR